MFFTVSIINCDIFVAKTNCVIFVSDSIGNFKFMRNMQVICKYICAHGFD